VLLNIDVVFLWLGTVVFISSTAIGLFRGTIADTILPSIVGVLILAVGALGPERKDDLSAQEKEQYYEDCRRAGYNAFALATVGGGMWVMYSIWDGEPAVSVAIYLALIQVPYLATRLYVRGRRASEQKKERRKGDRDRARERKE